MRQTLRPPLSRHALISNASDAAGNQTYDTAVSIIVVTILGFSATQVGLLNALGTLSFLLFAVPLGMAVDAVGAARILVASLGIKTALATLTFTLCVAGVLETVSAIVIVAIMGLATVASENAQTAIVPRLVDSTHETAHLVARMASADRIAGVVAPGGTGVLLTVAGAGVPLGLSAVLLILALLAAIRLLSPLPCAAATAHGHGTEHAEAGLPEERRSSASFSHGFALLLRNRFLLATTLLVTAGNMGLAIGDSVDAILVLRVLDLGTMFYGAMGTIAAITGLVASMLAPRIVYALPVRRIFVVGAIVQSAVAGLPLLALLNPAGGLVIMGAFSGLWAITLTITNIAGAAYAARAVPVTSLGRASAARRTITMGCVPIAALGGGVLADPGGIIAPLVVWPALTLMAAVVFFMLTARRRSPG